MTANGPGTTVDELAQRELLLAEAERIVHLGSWMWNTQTNDIRWSDEMFRILGFAPRSIEPTVELFFGAIHPDDLARVQDVAARRGLQGPGAGGLPHAPRRRLRASRAHGGRRGAAARAPPHRGLRAGRERAARARGAGPPRAEDGGGGHAGRRCGPRLQ
ncbi:MAG: PAS domain-containing protein [Sandaracinaceae bacterium]|nr:PAS domain-containing protein [Sandaracinaceae bacterium]